MRFNLIGFIFFLLCQTVFAQQTDIVFPKEGQSISEPFYFTWNKSLSADSYRISIGKDINHSDTVVSLEQNKLWFQPLTEGLYYWKVIALSANLPIDSSQITTFFYFNPVGIDSLNLWLRADSGVGLNGAQLASWQDLSDSSLFLIQSISARQPILINNALNQYPVLRFDSTDDEIVAPVQLLGPNYSISAVYNVREKKNRGIRLFDGTNNWLMGPHVNFYRTFNSVFSIGKATIQYRYVTHTVTTTQDTLRNFVNGILYDTKPEPYPPGNNLTISQNGLNGDLAEVLIVRGLLPDSVRAEVDKYLMDKYAPPINLGENRMVCSFPDSIEVNADYALSFQWSTGATSAKTLIDSAGKYYLTITDQFDRTSVDSILFIQDTANFQLDFGFNDTTICKGQELTITAAEERYSYQWNTAETTNTVQLDSAGLYILTVTNCLANQSVDSFNLNVNEPAFSLGSDTTNCFNQVLILQPDSNFSNVSFLWSNGMTTPSILADSSKNYFLTVMDSYQCAFSDSILVTVDSSLYGLTLGPDTSLCEGNFLGLSGDTTAIQQYLWGSGNTNPFERVDTAGRYNLRVSNNLCSFSDTVVVGIKGLAPFASFSSQFFCLGDSVLFANNSTAATGDTLTNSFWDFNGLATSNLENPRFSFPDTGLFQVLLRVTTDKGCEDTVSFRVDIQPLPKPDFSLVGNCSKRPVQLNSQSSIDEGFIQLFDWKLGNGQVSSAENPILTYDTLGNYNVVLKLTSNRGCIDSLQKQISIDPSPVPQFDFANQCFGDSTYLRSTSTIASGSIVEYVWFTNNQQIADSTAAVRYLAQGEQQVILRLNSDKNCLTLIRDTIDIYESPIADFFANDVCFGERVLVTDNSSAGADRITNFMYAFKKDTLIDSSTSQNPAFLPNTFGSHSIQLNITTENGCSDSIQKSIEVRPEPKADFRIVNNNSGAPYTLEVENKSSNASLYEWQSGDGKFSALNEPAFVYSDSGTYLLQLVAATSLGCKDTLEKKLTVLPYFLDASIEDAQLIEDQNGSYKIRLRFANNGNNKVEEMELLLEPENAIRLAETIESPIYKGGTLIYTLSTFLPPAENNASFICFTIGSVNGVRDDREENNQVCISAFPNKLYLTAYPNPVTDWLTVDFVLLTAGKISIRLYDSQGREVASVFDEEFLDEGYHQKRVNMSSLNAGVYIMDFIFEGFNDQIKIVRE